MKQKTYSGIIALLMLAVPAVSYGTTTVPERRAEMKQKFEERKASTTERIQERKASSTEKRASSTEKRLEMKGEILKRQAGRTEKMLGQMIEHMDRLASRIASRIEKVKAEGKDVSESEGFLAEGRVHLTEARTSLSTFSSLVLSKDNIGDIRVGASGVKNHLRLAHQSLVKAINSLKIGFNKATSTATSTLR